MDMMTQIVSPLDQFEIRNLISLDAPLLGNLSISLTNIGLYLTIGGFLVLMLFLLSSNASKVISNGWSLPGESIYATVHGIVVGQINNKSGQAYFPFMFVLFVFILLNNLIGMVPYSFASTSHFALTFSLSFTIALRGRHPPRLRAFTRFRGAPAGAPPATPGANEPTTHHAGL